MAVHHAREPIERRTAAHRARRLLEREPQREAQRNDKRDRKSRRHVRPEDEDPLRRFAARNALHDNRPDHPGADDEHGREPMQEDLGGVVPHWGQTPVDNFNRELCHAMDPKKLSTGV